MNIGKTPLTIIVGILGLLFIITTLILGLGAVGQLNSQTTPLIVTVLGVVTSSVASLLALFKGEQVHSDINNGVVTAKVQDALENSNIPGGDHIRTGADSVPVDVAAVSTTKLADIPVAAPAATPTPNEIPPNMSGDGH